MERTPHHRIRTARRKRGLTQTDLAGRLAVTPTTVSRWERGEARPRTRSLEQLAGVLEVPRDTLRPSHAREIASPPRVRNASRRIAKALDLLEAESGFARRSRRAPPKTAELAAGTSPPL